MSVAAILSILYITLGFELASSYCPPRHYNPHCRCRETSDSLEMSCRIDYIEELQTLRSGRHASHLTSLKILLSGVTTLPSSLLNYSNLISLTVHGSNLMYIEDRAFEGLKDNLAYLYVENTNLQQIPISAIINLTNLHTLGLEGNQISSFNASMRSLPLHSLLLFGNKISTIVRGKFPSTLVVLNLMNNRISSLNYSLTVNSLRLKELYISNNSIVRLTGQLTEVPTLTHLFANWNHIENIDDGSLATLRQLRILNLTHNRLYRIADGLKGLKSLVELDLSYNCLTHINEMAFSNLTLLQTLNLEHNNITYISGGLLNCLSSLQVLDISFNGLQDLNFLIPPSVSELNPSDVDFYNSCEHNTTHCTFRNYTTLETVRMSDSGVVCDNEVERIIGALISENVTVDGNPCRIL